ncbi:hypothetical protein EDD37DRAFT_479973 [Exophiala viscosa]|uniref:DUF6314 domain-containing protein n=1 Tax=Exophiala viscosa TaxID=2486360 RepID=A0AAN6DWA5_9EURO|nr:hypothetical protein EDD36DRAFT_209865 [Exophiala viscosa]KAI1622552.1 hypothetical protein EDD37DRAFT_479973 [Exophiala viscosa]
MIKQTDYEGGSSMSTITARLFETLHGTWVLHRSLQSANAAEPSGRCTGKATFTRRQPSPVIDDSGKLQLADDELLYHEQGEFELTPSISNQDANFPKFPFSRKYIWRLQRTEGVHKISVWFTKPGTNEIDYLFHNVDIAPFGEDVSTQSHDIALHGSGGHVCVHDFYSSLYTFNVTPKSPESITLTSWSMTHEVRGPKKDQTIETTFTRT